MSALDDFAKRPNGYKAAVIGVIAAVLGLLYFQFLWKPTSAEAAKAEADYNSEKSRRETLERDEKDYKRLLSENDQIVKQLNDMQRALPTEAELPAFFDAISRRLGEAGVEVRRWDQRKEEPFEGFYRVPVDIELTGSFYKIKRFFASLAKPAEGSQAQSQAQTADMDRIITIQNLDISDPKVRDGELTLTAKFTASTFREDAPALPTSDPKAAKDAKSGKDPKGAKNDAKATKAGSK